MQKKTPLKKKPTSSEKKKKRKKTCSHGYYESFGSGSPAEEEVDHDEFGKGKREKKSRTNYMDQVKMFSNVSSLLIPLVASEHIYFEFAFLSFLSLPIVVICDHI